MQERGSLGVTRNTCIRLSPLPQYGRGAGMRGHFASGIMGPLSYDSCLDPSAGANCCVSLPIAAAVSTIEEGSHDRSLAGIFQEKGIVAIGGIDVVILDLLAKRPQSSLQLL
jgi:hypothetical protein